MATEPVTLADSARALAARRFTQAGKPAKLMEIRCPMCDELIAELWVMSALTMTYKRKTGHLPQAFINGDESGLLRRKHWAPVVSDLIRGSEQPQQDRPDLYGFCSVHGQANVDLDRLLRQTVTFWAGPKIRSHGAKKPEHLIAGTYQWFRGPSHGAERVVR